MKPKLQPILPRPSLRMRSRCWWQRHDLQLYISAVKNITCWRCRRCTGLFSKPVRHNVTDRNPGRKP